MTSMHTQPLQTGSVVSVWHGSRGNLYVLAGINFGSKTLSFIKHNCINNDGSIHKLTKQAGKIHLTVPFEILEDDETEETLKIVPKINRVLGTRNINFVELATFVRRDVGSNTMRCLKPEHAVYPGVEAEDHRLATTFA